MFDWKNPNPQVTCPHYQVSLSQSKFMAKHVDFTFKILLPYNNPQQFSALFAYLHTFIPSFLQMQFVLQINKYFMIHKFKNFLFSQPDSIRGPVRHPVCPPVCPFQLASESLCDVVARRRSDYCPRGAIFFSTNIYQKFFLETN